MHISSFSELWKRSRHPLFPGGHQNLFVAQQFSSFSTQESEPSANLTQHVQDDQEHVRKCYLKNNKKKDTKRFQGIMILPSFLFRAHHRLARSQHIYISERSTNMGHLRDPFFLFSFFPSLPLVLPFLLFISSFKTHLIEHQFDNDDTNSPRACILNQTPGDKTKNFFLVIFSMR